MVRPFDNTFGNTQTACFTVGVSAKPAGIPRPGDSGLQDAFASSRSMAGTVHMAHAARSLSHTGVAPGFELLDGYGWVGAEGGQSLYTAYPPRMSSITS